MAGDFAGMLFPSAGLEQGGVVLVESGAEFATNV